MRPCRHDDVCEWFRERLELFLDGELSGSENFRFQQHLKECDDCALYWADDEEAAERLILEFAAPLDAAASLPPDEDYRPRIPRVGEERTISHHSTAVVLDRGRRLLYPLLATAAAALLLVALVAERLVPDGDRDAPTQGVEVASGKAARIYPQGRVAVRSAGGVWRPILEAADIASGVELRAERDSRILVDLGGSGHFVLGEDSFGRIEELGESLRLEIVRGRFSCDLEDRDLRLIATGLELAARDVAFDLRTAESAARTGYESRIAVTRGALQARSDVGAARRLSDGDVYAVRDGILVAFDGIESEYADVMLATMPRSDLGADLDELPTDMAGIRGENVAMPLASARPRIERWLDRVVAAGGLDIVDPDRASRLMMERVAVRGDSVLADVEDLYRRAEDAVARRALVGLVGEMGGERVRAFLLAASHDLDLRVRKASLLVLSRRSEPSLGPHFLDVMRRETDTDLRLSAAFLAAAMGEHEGFALMRSMYDEATSSYWRQTVVALAARLDESLPGREDFLLLALEGFDPAEGLPMLEVLIDALSHAGDRARLERALRSALADDERLGPAMRRSLEAMLRRLDS